MTIAIFLAINLSAVTIFDRGFQLQSAQKGVRRHQGRVDDGDGVSDVTLGNDDTKCPE